MKRLALVWLMTVISLSASAQIFELGEMNTREIAALDREKTVVLIPGGLMEQHGPYLPANADGYMSEWLTRRLAERLVERPGWTVVIFPTINIGSGSANVIGGQHVFPGSFDVRNTTLRDVFMDLATGLGEQGFRWIFPIHLHGYPAQNAALDQAGDYFHDTYGGRMVHLMGLMPIFDCCGEQRDRLLSEVQREEDGFSVHAGAGEHSMLLFLRPDLVAADRSEAASQTAKDLPDLMSVAAAGEWPGYFGAPRHASAALGGAHMRQMAEVTAEVANRILDGLDPRELPRYADIMAQVPPLVDVVRRVEQQEKRIESQQREWLDGRTADQVDGYDPVLAEKLGADERGMKMYVLCILKTGPNDATVQGDDRKQIFAGHFENINQLAEEGLLALAGPFGKNDKTYRGLYIFNVPTIEEAEKLVVRDPAVEAGVFVPELTPWYGAAALMLVNESHHKLEKPKEPESGQ